jgi:hypothetical protein
MSDEKEPSGAQKAFGEFAPGFVHFTDDVLFGQVWPRTELSPKERSLVTVSVLAAFQRAAHLPPGPGQAERQHRDRAEGSDHPHRLLRRLAAGHVRDDRGQAGLRRLTTRNY